MSKFKVGDIVELTGCSIDRISWVESFRNVPLLVEKLISNDATNNDLYGLKLMEKSHTPYDNYEAGESVNFYGKDLKLKGPRKILKYRDLL